ncbi:tetratricopeptide repeat protein [Solihabitans fulvus]|uniref:tetratricopeptide repeat protein n=1 Tax=Solihabitans fulvus TaxID=1892852 RepID=UPI001661F7CD|nr:tetratricopeptide repeat protein [Solihabitans fulvus]
MTGRFGALLRRLRRQAGLTQEELASRSGLGVRTIRGFETGERADPRVVTVGLLADALELGSAARDELLAAAVGVEHGGGDSGSSAGRVPRQLPAQPGVFVGRHQELAALDKSLDAAAGHGGTVVVSAIGGGGGVGKTWLALRWAHQNLDRFPDGQLFVDLRGFAADSEPVAPGQAVRGFLDALGVPAGSIPAELDARAGLYRSLVAGKRMLVVLDNARDTSQVIPLLPGSPASTVLVTSRDRLAGLVVAHGAIPMPLDVLDDLDARDLLARRMGHDRLAMEPEATAALLRHCAGLPLALAVVAARAALSPDVSLAELAAELRDTATRLGALDAGDPAASVRTVLSWSHAALEPEQARVLALLGVAPGADISVPATASLTGLSEAEVGAVLRGLERVSVIERHALGRYRTHDLVKLFAADQARHDLPADAIDAALRRLVDHYLHTAFAGERLLDPHRQPIQLPEPVAGCHPRRLDDQAAALAWLDTEHPNLLAAQQVAANQGWHAAVWQFAWSLQTFLWRRGHLHDNLATWRAGLAAARRSGDPAAEARAHRILGRSLALVGLHADATRHLGEALALAERSGDPVAQVHAHNSLALAWGQQGEDGRALEHAERALALCQTLGDPAWEVDALNNTGFAHAKLGHQDQARASCEAALNLGRANNYRLGEAAALDSLGYIAHHSDHHATALDYYRDALALYRELGNAYYEADTLDSLAKTYQALGQLGQARDARRQALRLYQAQHRTEDADRVQDALDALDPAR